MTIASNHKYSIEVEGWIKPHILPASIPKGKSKLFAWGGLGIRFRFTKLISLILKGLSVYKTNAHVHSMNSYCNDVVVLICILIHQTNVYCGVYHKQTTLELLNECNSRSKVFPPYNVYVCAVKAYWHKTDFLELVQFRGILGHFRVFLPNVCEGKQMKQIHL